MPWFSFHFYWVFGVLYAFPAILSSLLSSTAIIYVQRLLLLKLTSLKLFIGFDLYLFFLRSWHSKISTKITVNLIYFFFAQNSRLQVFTAWWCSNLLDRLWRFINRHFVIYCTQITLIYCLNDILHNPLDFNSSK